MSLSLLNEKEKDNVLSALQMRSKMAIRQIYLVADFLDPSSKGNNFSEDQMLECLTYLQSLADKFQIHSNALLTEYAEYSTDSGKKI